MPISGHLWVYDTIQYYIILYIGTLILVVNLCVHDTPKVITYYGYYVEVYNILGYTDES